MTVPLPSAAVAVPAPAVLEQLPAATPVPEVAHAPPRRLAGLDGVRGLAALFVVVNHVFLRAFPGYPVDKAPFWAAWFIYGRFAVVVFIVLSGFSLALSPARHGWRLDGVSRFARRRAWRILPPYWAALVFSLAVAWLLVRPPGQGSARLQLGLRQRPAGAEPGRGPEPEPGVLVDRRRGPAVRAVPAAAADGPPSRRDPHGRRGHAGRGDGGDRRPARLPPRRVRDPVGARPGRAVRGRHPGGRHRGRERGLAGRGRGRGSRWPRQHPCS